MGNSLKLETGEGLSLEVLRGTFMPSYPIYLLKHDCCRPVYRKRLLHVEGAGPAHCASDGSSWGVTGEE